MTKINIVGPNADKLSDVSFNGIRLTNDELYEWIMKMRDALLKSDALSAELTLLAGRTATTVSEALYPYELQVGA